MIRDEASRKLARQLLERRLSRTNPLTEEFIGVVAKMIQAYVAMDEQKQRTEAGSSPKPKGPLE